jgi:hypothetical protein
MLYMPPQVHDGDGILKLKKKNTKSPLKTIQQKKTEDLLRTSHKLLEPNKKTTSNLSTQPEYPTNDYSYSFSSF